MKKGLIMLLSLMLVLSSCITAYADDVNIGTVIPEYHTVTVESDGGKIAADGKVCGDTVQIKRHSEQAYWILPDTGKELDALYYNGEDVTAQVKNGVFIAPSLSNDAEIRAVFKDAPAVDSDKTYDISGTLTDEDGNPIPDAVVDIGGKTGKTDEDGNFTVKDVPSGTHTVIVKDENGEIIGHTQLTIGEPGSGSLTLTTDENGNYVITPGGSTKAIVLEMSIGENGVITVKSAKDAADGNTDVKKNESKTSPNTGNDFYSHTLIFLPALAALMLLPLKKRRKSSH